MGNKVEADLIETFDAVRVDENGRRAVEESVAGSAILAIYLNGMEVISLVCSPNRLDALAVGFLVSENLLESRNDLDSVTVVEGKTYVADVAASGSRRADSSLGRVLMTPGCGGGATFANLLDDIDKFAPLPDTKFRVDAILEGARELGRNAPLFSATGGAHTAALFNGEGLAYTAEDVGRHNALDKVLGAAFLDDVEIAGSGLVTSGRLSADAVIKALVSRIPLLVSRTAPTSMAVKLARRAGLTLVGFTRGKRMNVYSGEVRVGADIPAGQVEG